MADQRAINKAGHRFRTGLELAPEFFAQIAGALFGVLSGFGLLLGAFIADIKSLQSTAGRRQIVYGRQGHKPVAFEGTEEGPTGTIQAKAKSTYASAKQTASDAVTRSSETAAHTKSTVYGKASQTKSKAGQVLEGANINPETLPGLKTTQPKSAGSTSVGFGTTVPTKSVRSTTSEKVVPRELDSELTKGPAQHVNVSQKSKSSYVSKTNGEHQPSSAPVILPDGAIHEDSPGEEEDDERSGPLSRNSSMSDHSSVTDLPKRPKRGKRVINKLKGVFKA